MGTSISRTVKPFDYVSDVIPIAMTYYEKALDISQVGMCRMLDDFEKLKVSLHPNFWAQLSRYC